MNDKNIWYIKRGEAIKGPYPAGQVSRYILLGRIREGDELSQDRQIWRPLNELTDLIPAALVTDPTDPTARARLEAAWRWADERVAADGRRADENATVWHERRVAERRQPEPEHLVQYRRIRQTSTVNPAPAGINPGRGALFGAVAGVVLLAIVAGWYAQSGEHAAARDCTKAAQRGVNWNECVMEGARLAQVDLTHASLRGTNLRSADLHGAQLTLADLSYAVFNQANLQQADLSNAHLTGASLRGVDLRGADLRGADLSYTDLSDAKLDGAVMTEARLDKAIWTDGQVCAIASRGTCRH